jgi:hypothetical protein
MIAKTFTATKDTNNIHINHEVPNFTTAVQALSDYLLTLPLLKDQKNWLVELIAAQVAATERKAFCSGLEYGLRIAKVKERNAKNLSVSTY